MSGWQLILVWVHSSIKRRIYHFQKGIDKTVQTFCDSAYACSENVLDTTLALLCRSHQQHRSLHACLLCLLLMKSPIIVERHSLKWYFLADANFEWLCPLKQSAFNLANQSCQVCITRGICSFKYLLSIMLKYIAIYLKFWRHRKL